MSKRYLLVMKSKYGVFKTLFFYTLEEAKYTANFENEQEWLTTIINLENENIKWHGVKNMKKILSILGAIGLTATSTTSLISCEKPKSDNNSENGNNKPEPEKPQQPPKNSKWKLINKIIDFWNLTPNNKWYILLLNNYVSNNWNIMKIHLTMNPRDIIFEPKNLLKSVYLWDGEGEPQTPIINLNTGEITDWKG